ncbi:DUF1549 and DUF1553 domain-containing protein [Candidatus Laterigemmans baculatus]|uniref:DUF1549 and DUF1553 domain-containing protein n=1 Tax=Candidatus Laterigemmans baculatus TaxID=2770505 RepID=UPI0013DB7882|nr:DUF1549 and DUF1553 domain-containing protein [Candidatus Laterigemmans baculatus]
MFGNVIWAALAVMTSAALMTSAASAAEPAPEPAPSSKSSPAATPRVDVYPPEILLDSDRDYQGFIAVMSRPDGVTVDVTEEAEWTLSNPKLVTLDGTTLRPAADGETELVCNYGGSEVRIPVKVTNAGAHPPISFTKDIMPVLTRSGCNTGSCHGAARGKDGFNLSLFGFDPAGDYQRITREIGFRRVNLARPDQSLLLLKSIGAVPHTGGKRFEVDSPYYKAMLEWLEAGVPQDAADKMPPAVESVAIYPPQAVIEGEGSTQRFLAVARYADGTTRDVTNLAAFSTNNASTAAIDQEGRVVAGVRGEAFVMARFDTHTVGSQVLALPKDLQYTPPEISGNYIDQLVGKKLQQLRILPSDLCTDEEFLRRVTIDITGLLPTEEEYRQFVNDPAPNKRAELIDRLLERKEFSEIWAMKFAQLLMIKSSNVVSYKSAFLYNQWLTDQFAREVPFDQTVRDLLSSTGGTFTNPATNFYELERDTLKTAENVAQVFGGIRTQCAQCHNHPFDRWTMDDYYGFAAFFSQIGRKQGEDYREKIVYNRGGGEVRHPVGNAVMAPKFLGGEAPDTRGKDRREVLATWLTSPDNPYFGTSIANRVWAHFMGSGLVEPVDDIRVSNPASNPELFETLGAKLAEYDFDFKRLVRDICNSHAYQRSVTPNDSNRSDTRNYAYATVRRIPAENLLDCLSQVTATKDKFRGLPLGARAVQIADGSTSTYFLTAFGRAPRNTVCECEASTDPSLSQALHLLNGPSVHNKILQGGVVKSLLDEKKTPAEVIETLFIRVLGRTPTADEQTKLQEQVAAAANPQQGLEDVFWALLNSREFVFNH